MRKSEKNAFFSKTSKLPILIAWNLILNTFLCTKIKNIVHFLSLDDVQDPCADLIALSGNGNLPLW